MAMRGLHGQPMSVGVLFSQLSKIWKYVLQSLAVFAGVLIIVLPIVVIIFLVFVGPVDPRHADGRDHRTTPGAAPDRIREPAACPSTSTSSRASRSCRRSSRSTTTRDPSTPISIPGASRGASGWKIIGVGLLAVLIVTGRRCSVASAFCSARRCAACSWARSTSRSGTAPTCRARTPARPSDAVLAAPAQLGWHGACSSHGRTARRLCQSAPGASKG